MRIGEVPVHRQSFCSLCYQFGEDVQLSFVLVPCGFSLHNWPAMWQNLAVTSPFFVVDLCVCVCVCVCKLLLNLMCAPDD